LITYKALPPSFEVTAPETLLAHSTVKFNVKNMEWIENLPAGGPVSCLLNDQGKFVMDGILMCIFVKSGCIATYVTGTRQARYV
jgi:hypothetical protein